MRKSPISELFTHEFTFDAPAGLDEQSLLPPSSNLEALIHLYRQSEYVGSFAWSGPGSGDLTDIDLISPLRGAPGAVAGDIVNIDLVSFAKGGAGGGGGPGGGGSGGGGGDGGATALTQYKSGSGDGDAGYDIFIEFKGTGWTTALQQAFLDAADYLTTIITADIGPGGVYRGKVIDDLYVTAELKAIDGAGNVLGQAGPSSLWTTNELTAIGVMQFDTADAVDFLGRGLWDEIVTHEFLHVLGFGSLWNYGADPLVSEAGQYTGQFGLAAYRNIAPGADYIPVETDYGAGTADSHWDEALLGNELMTGFLGSNAYLADFSLMSLADLGYTVNPGATANPYPSTAA